MASSSPSGRRGAPGNSKGRDFTPAELAEALCWSLLKSLYEDKKKLGKDMIVWKVFNHLFEAIQKDVKSLPEKLAVTLRPRGEHDYHCELQPLPADDWGRACIDQAYTWARSANPEMEYAWVAKKTGTDVAKYKEVAKNAINDAPTTFSVSRRLSGAFTRGGGDGSRRAKSPPAREGAGSSPGSASASPSEFQLRWGVASSSSGQSLATEDGSSRSGSGGSPSVRRRWLSIASRRKGTGTSHSSASGPPVARLPASVSEGAVSSLAGGGSGTDDAKKEKRRSTSAPAVSAVTEE